MAAAINAHLEMHPDHVDISCDARNAFNSWCRTRLWQPLLTTFPAIYALCKLIYGSPSDVVFFEEGVGLTSILNAVGSRQGCSLGSLLYCLAIHPLLLKLQGEFPDLLILAYYCDDVHIVGPPELAIPAYRRWAQLYSQALQGELRDEKGKAYAPNVPEHVLNELGLPTFAPGSTTQPGEMPYTQAGLRILGAPVGSPEFCLKFSEELVDAVSAELGILGRMPSLQSQHTIATKSSVHRITHLLRTIPGGELDMYGPLAAAYDAAVLAVPARICKNVSLPQTAARIAQQPLGSGGLGYRTWKSIADTAFLAAYVHASIQIPALFPQLGHMFPDVRTLIRTAPSRTSLTTPAAPSSVSHFAARAAARLIAETPAVLEALAPVNGQTPRQLQHRIGLLVDGTTNLQIAQELSQADNPSHPRHKAARHSSLGDAYTPCAIPGDQTTINNEHFSIIVRLKLLLPVYPSNGPTDGRRMYFRL